LRDSGQLQVVAIIVDQAHASWHSRMEQPISASAGDRRAADLILTGPTEVLHIEVERRLVDLQAQLRSAQLKRAALAADSDRPVRLILAMPDTRTNRAIVRSLGEVSRIALPATSAAVWRTIRTGIKLGADGFLFVPMHPSITPG
jgi:hypothetical protein